MIPVKTVSFSKAIPLPGGAFSAVTESMGFSILLMPSLQCIQLEVVREGSKDLGKKCLVPLGGVVKMELPGGDEMPAFGDQPVLQAVQDCDFGGTGEGVVFH